MSHSRSAAATRLLLALVALVALIVQPAGGDGALDRGADAPGAGQRPGEPCRIVHQYPVSFTADAGGRLQGTFTFAGGAFRGSLPVSSEDASNVGVREAFVTDVQLGSYEPLGSGQPDGSLACRVDPTFHFYCPATDTLDELCYTWIERSTGRRGDGR